MEPADQDQPAQEAVSPAPVPGRITYVVGTMVTRDMLAQPADGGEPRCWHLRVPEEGK